MWLFRRHLECQLYRSEHLDLRTFVERYSLAVVVVAHHGREDSTRYRRQRSNRVKPVTITGQYTTSDAILDHLKTR